MADLSQTPGSVVPSSAAVLEQHTAGATIVAGNLLYMDTSDSNKMKLAQCDGTELEATLYGIAAVGASAGQPVVVVRKDTALAIGATVAVSDVFVASATAGALAPVGDLATTEYFSLAGWANSTTEIACNFTFAGNSTAATHV